MNTGTERDAIESIHGSLRPFRLEAGQRFADGHGSDLHLVGISRPNFIGGDRDGRIAVLSHGGLKEGIDPPKFQVVDCAGLVVIRPQTAEERAAERIPDGFASRFVVEAAVTTGFDIRGRCVVLNTGTKTSYPLLITAGVND